jgi:PAS domain S-box-containing protein
MRKNTLNTCQTFPANLSGSLLPELVANLMSNLPGIAYRCKNDQWWTMMYMSEGCASVTGYTANELLENSNKSFSSLIYPDDLDYVRKNVDEAIANRTRFQMEYRIWGKEGDLRWVWEQGNAIYSADNQVMFLDGYIADITQRKRIEDEVKQAARSLVELNATKDKFFSLIAHDLQNPVYAILSLSEFLSSNLDKLEGQELITFVNLIQTSAKGIYSLLENLLDWTKLQTGKVKVQKEYLSLSKVTEFVVSQYSLTAEEKGVSIIYANTQDVVVESDSHLLTTIIRNLVSNAVKYSHPGSKVHVNTTQEEDYACVEVIDTGIGISRRNLAKIFNIDNDVRHPGTKDEPGSGLGLILSKDIANLLGATLSAESKINKGSKFKLCVPVKLSKS